MAEQSAERLVIRWVNSHLSAGMGIRTLNEFDDGVKLLALLEGLFGVSASSSSTSSSSSSSSSEASLERSIGHRRSTSVMNPAATF
jgi:TctA family transporter